MAKLILRQLVRQYITEAAASASEAASAGVALFAEVKKHSVFITMYDADKLEKRMARNRDREGGWDPEEELYRTVGPCVVGYMFLHPPRVRKAPCYGAWEVGLSAARKGYGPLLYDAALSLTPSHTIMSDRKSVSKAAGNVWDYYVNKRTDVDALKLDDFLKPETPPPEDDCQVHKDPDRPFLDYAIQGNPVDVSALVGRHREAVRNLGELDEHFDPDIIADAISKAGEQFFRARYYDTQSA